MTVETSTYISQLNSALPAVGDLKSEGDEHIRKIKANLQATFPNLTAAAVTPTTTELNYVDGVTSPIQTQLDAKASITYVDSAVGGGATYTPSVTGGVASTVSRKLDDVVSAFDFMTSSQIADVKARTLLVDVTTALQAAIDYVETNGGSIYMPAGSYLTSAELVIDKPGVSIRGTGTGTTWDGLENPGTRVVGSHTTGSVIRIKWESCTIENLVIDATSARTAASSDYTTSSYNAGIRVEADDVAAPEGDVFSTSLQNVYVRNQPNDGFLFIGRTYQSYGYNLYASGNKGHGFCMDMGRRSNRTNYVVSGVTTLVNCYFYSNHGHGLAVGNPSDVGSTDTPAIRFTCINVESGNNLLTPALAYESYEAYIRADNVQYIGGAFSGNTTQGGLFISGSQNRIENCRYLSCTQPARVGFYAGDTVRANVFLGMSIRTSTSSTAVLIDTGATRTEVILGDTTSVTSAVDQQQLGDIYRYSTDTYHQGVYNSSGFSSGRSLTLLDDGFDTYTFGGTFAYGVVVINGPTAGSGPCIVGFRVGTSAYAVLMGGDVTYAAVGTGALTTGTSDGVDTKLNVYAHTDGKLYIKNRTSATRTYTVTFLSMGNDRISAGQ